MPDSKQTNYPQRSSDLICKSAEMFAYLRWLRVTRGLTQAALASAVKISQSELHKVESSQQACRLTTFVGICNALALPPGWALDMMIHGNVVLFHERVAEDPGFALLLESLQIADKSGRKAMAMELSCACLLSAILLRVSCPTRRARFQTYPTADWRERFLNFAQWLEASVEEIDRGEIIRALHEQPIAELQRRGLLSRESLELKRDDLSRPKDERRGGSFGGELHGLTFGEVAFLWQVLPRGLQKSLLPYKDKIDMSQGACGSVAGMRLEVPTWNQLKKSIAHLTSERGAKAALAKELGVSRQVLNNWLSDAGQGAPPADLTLRLFRWSLEQGTPKPK